MSFFVGAYLVQDGLAEGALYCLLAMALVFVFALTRIILIPQGEFVAFGALTYIGLREGRSPALIGLVLAIAALAVVKELARGAREARLAEAARDAWGLAWPCLSACALAYGASRSSLPPVHAVAAILLISSMGPPLYVLVYKSIAQASVLVLLVVSVALHLVLNEFGLFLFGPGGGRAEPLFKLAFALGGVRIPAQFLVIYFVTAVLATLLWLGSERTLYGKVFRAAAMNATGARLMGISIDRTGRSAFLVAAFIGAVTGVLVSSVTTIYYDSGFLIALKGFVAAIMGGLASYPLSVAGALGLGQIESFSSFFASSYKEAIVFSLIIPVLLWRSLTSRRVEEDE